LSAITIQSIKCAGFRFEELRPCLQCHEVFLLSFTQSLGSMLSAKAIDTFLYLPNRATKFLAFGMGVGVRG
jgi:hypothetical protein